MLCNFFLEATANFRAPSGRTSFYRSGNARSLTVAKFHEIARKPASLNWDQSASTPIGALMAFQALFDYHLLFQPGSRE